MTNSDSIKTFEGAVMQASEGAGITALREILEQVCPHRDIALVASYGILTEDSCALVLGPDDFERYTEGHPWLFPAHWLIEMAALAAGFQAKRMICEKLGFAECIAFSRPMVIKGGEWQKQPPACDPKSREPIKATVQNFNIHIGGKVKYYSDVVIQQGEKIAVLVGIAVIIAKGGKQESSGE